MKKQIKCIAIGTFCLSQLALASNMKCTVARVAGMFQSYTQPQVGDTLVFDADAETLTELNVGTASILTTTDGLRQDSLEGILRFTAKEEGEAKYKLQLIISGDDLAMGTLQSVLDSRGFISVGVAELNCVQ